MWYYVAFLMWSLRMLTIRLISSGPKMAYVCPTNRLGSEWVVQHKTEVLPTDLGSAFLAPSSTQSPLSSHSHAPNSWPKCKLSSRDFILADSWGSKDLWDESVVVLLVVSPLNEGCAFNFVSLWVDALEDGGLVVFGYEGFGLTSQARVDLCAWRFIHLEIH